MSALEMLETKRLLLRGVEAEHIPDYSRFFADYEVISQLSAKVPWPFPEDGVRQFLEQKIFPRQGLDHWLWGLFLKSNPKQLIGAVDLWREGKPQHRGFWLGRAFWGQGLMFEASQAVNAYAFTHLGFDRLVFANARGNKRSRRIKEKSGARLIRVEPAQFVDPSYSEHEVWELTRQDWERTQKS